MDENLKMYVWENVLRDYTSGMVVILAKDLDEAKNKFLEKYKDDANILTDFFGAEHKVITKSEAFYVYGGG